MKRIVLHIDRLVLNGVDRVDAQALSAGLQTELQRLLSVPGTTGPLAAAGDRVRVRGADVPMAADGDGRQMGHAIAGSIVKGMAR